jgi:epoxyqueuosine reductase
VLERGWAAAAGVGWQGKNAMLISREHGNWLLLAAILTRCDVPPDEILGTDRPPGAGRVAGAPGEDGAERNRDPAPPAERAPRLGLHCGSCTRCIDACPTNAFPRPGWVDARRCIAYHTIENRGVIPRELRPGIGPRVFGCDVCLDVCPWNRFAQAGRTSLLVARTELTSLSLLDLLALDEGRFRAVFHKSPIKRVKLPGLLRNACIAAGNWHESREWHFGGAEKLDAVAAAVERLCAHDSAIVRTHAVWALRRVVGDDEAARRLHAVRAEERDAAVIAEYASAR